MPSKTPLTTKEIKELKEQLLEERRDRRAQFDELQQSTFGTNQSDLTGEMGFDEEYADAGTATFERERDLPLLNNLRDLVERIDKALAKIEDGTFGICEECGDEIGIKRLEARRVTDLCVKCKEDEEQREKEYAEG